MAAAGEGGREGWGVRERRGGGGGGLRCASVTH